MAIIQPQPLHIVEVYIDESSTRHRYLVLGAIVTPSANIAEFTDMLRAARLPELPYSEMKWTKVSTSKLGAYIRFVDAFFSQPRGSFDFHSAIVDTSLQRHQLFNQGSREVGFNKEVYQLALKCSRLYQALFHIYPDRRVTNQRRKIFASCSIGRFAGKATSATGPIGGFNSANRMRPCLSSLPSSCLALLHII